MALAGDVPVPPQAVNPVLVADAHMLRIPSHLPALFQELLPEIQIADEPLVRGHVLYLRAAALVDIDGVLDGLLMDEESSLLQVFQRGFPRFGRAHALVPAGILVVPAVSAHDVDWPGFRMPGHPLDAVNPSIGAVVHDARAVAGLGDLIVGDPDHVSGDGDGNPQSDEVFSFQLFFNGEFHVLPKEGQRVLACDPRLFPHPYPRIVAILPDAHAHAAVHDLGARGRVDQE